MYLTCQVRVIIWLRSSLLCGDFFWALINSLVCWFFTPNPANYSFNELFCCDSFRVLINSLACWFFTQNPASHSFNEIRAYTHKISKRTHQNIYTCHCGWELWWLERYINWKPLWLGHAAVLQFALNVLMELVWKKPQVLPASCRCNNTNSLLFAVKGDICYL